VILSTPIDSDINGEKNSIRAPGLSGVPIKELNTITSALL
jgi:hypothetical protein